MEKIKKFLFQNTEKKQTVMKNTFWLFTSEATGRLLKMGLIIYAARVLGVNGWGIFSYSVSVGALLMIMSDFGIGDLIMREATQKKENYKTFISTALVLKIILVVLSILVVIFVGPIISHVPEARAIFPIVSLILLFDSLRELGLAINRVSEKMERDMIVKTITNTVIFGLGVLLLKAHSDPSSIAIAYAVGSAVGFFTISIIIWKDLKKLLSKIDTRMFMVVFQITWPFAIIALIGVIMGNVDIYMLGVWRDSGEIGLYSAVQRIQQFVMIIPSTMAVAVFPLLAKLANVDKVQFRSVLEKIISLIMIVCIPITVGGVLLANKIVPFIFGQDYMGAVPILQVLMLMLLVSAPLVILSNVIFAYNKQKELVVAYSSGIFANVLLNLLLVPKFGAVGSAVATLISTSIIVIYIWNKIKKINYFEIKNKLYKSIIATIVMIFVILLLQKLGVNLIINISISALTYMCSLLILKESTFREIRAVLAEKKPL